MRITENKLRRLVRGVLVEYYEIERRKEKEAYMMSLFKNPVDIADILNRACSKVKIRKSSNVNYYVVDNEIVEKAMNEDERLSSYFGGRMGVKDSLGGDDIAKIEGVLRKILSGCSLGQKNACSIEVEDVKKVTDHIASYSDIGL